MFNKEEYLRAYRIWVEARDKWDRQAQESLPGYLRERAQINRIDAQREINDLYSALLAHGVSHEEIRG